MKKAVVVILLAIIAVIAFLSLPEILPTHINDDGADVEDIVPLSADAYHYNGTQKWTEWWYYNFIDEQQGIEMFMMYIIFNPESSGMSNIMVGVYKDGLAYDLRDVYRTDDFSASEEVPYVKIKDNVMKALDEDTYEIHGAISDINYITASWNLTYERAVVPFDPPEKPGEMNYLIYMPSASVSGIVVIDGETYTITNARGYHDHDWGEPPFSAVLYNWAEFSDPDNEFFMMVENVSDGGMRLIGVLLGDETILFDDITVTFSDYVNEIGFSYPGVFVYPNYPRTWHLSAENEEYAIDVDIHIVTNLPLYAGGEGPGLSFWSIFASEDSPYLINEQVSWFSGKITKNGEQLHSFTGEGFSEYTQ